MYRYDTINQNYRRRETVDIRALKTFILVSELSSFTKTAEKLGYAQSTVSSQIKQLEEEIDRALECGTMEDFTALVKELKELKSLRETQN